MILFTDKIPSELIDEFKKGVGEFFGIELSILNNKLYIDNNKYSKDIIYILKVFTDGYLLRKK